MTDLATLTPLADHATRPVRYGDLSFKAFRIAESNGRLSRLQIADDHVTVEEAIDDAKLRCIHKDKLLIRSFNDRTGEVRLHLYAIKRQSRANYVYRDYQTVREHPMYAEAICVIDGEAL